MATLHTPELYGGLEAKDFPHQTVHLKFEDGSEVKFNSAFTKNEADNLYLVVYTEHLGYHVFYKTTVVELNIK